MRLIDADALKKSLEKLWNVHDDQDFANKDVWREIENAPTIEPEKRTVKANYHSEAEAVTAWNKAMGERTAKVVHSTTFGEWKNMCGHCFAKGRKMGLFPGQNYCYECGCKLDWSDDERFD